MYQVHADICTCPTCQEWGRLNAIAKSQLTPRDLFAGCALIGLFAREGYSGWTDDIRMTQDAFDTADAMMEERGKQSAS